MENISIMITGHRPDKLFGYNIHSNSYDSMRERFQQIFDTVSQQHNKITVYNGGSLGADQIFAEESIKFEKDHDVYNIMAVPFPKQSDKWSTKDKINYSIIKSNMDEIITIDISYSAKALQKRNEYMVDRSDKVFSVWDHENHGGTYNCIQYAIKKGKPIINYNFDMDVFERIN